MDPTSLVRELLGTLQDYVDAYGDDCDKEIKGERRCASGESKCSGCRARAVIKQAEEALA